MASPDEVTGRQLWAGMAFGIGAALIWGAWPVVSKLGIGQALGPMDITALRFAVAGLFLLPIVFRKGFGGLRFWQALVLAAGAGVPYVLVSVAGLTFAPAAHSGVINPAAMLIFSSLGGWWLLGDAPGRRVAGLAVLLAGVALTGFNTLADGSTTSTTNWIGDLLFVAGGFLWATYTVLVKRWAVAPLQATAIVSVISMVGFLPVYFIQTGGTALLQASWTELLLQGGFQGICAAFLALLFYSKAVALLGAGRGAVFAALVPGTAMILAYPVLGERPQTLELAGLALVTFGMLQVLGLIRRRRRPATA